MTEPQHPLTPPPELVKQWLAEPEYGTPGRVTLHTISEQRLTRLLARAAQWGYDQREPEIQAAADAELEACCLALENELCCFVTDDLRAARRPKPPSLAEEARAHLDQLINAIGREGALAMAELIRRALEKLQQLENNE